MGENVTRPKQRFKVMRSGSSKVKTSGRDKAHVLRHSQFYATKIISPPPVVHKWQAYIKCNPESSKPITGQDACTPSQGTNTFFKTRSFANLIMLLALACSCKAYHTADITLHRNKLESFFPAFSSVHHADKYILWTRTLKKSVRNGNVKIGFTWPIYWKKRYFI